MRYEIIYCVNYEVFCEAENEKNSPFNIWQSQIFHMRKRISQQSYFTRRKANRTEKTITM